MQFDVVVPTRGDKTTLTRILSCIAAQSLQPYRVIFVVNGFDGTILHLQGEVSKHLSPELYKKVEWHVISMDSPHTGSASYARNVGRSLAQSEYIYFLDDDNIFSYDFFARSIAEYLKLKQEYKKDLIYSPTIQWRDTDTVQSQGITTYHYMLGRPEPVQFHGWKNRIVQSLRWVFPLSPLYHNTSDYCRVASIGGNSLFGPRGIFASHPFNESLPFVYEDIECMYRITASGVPLIVSKKVVINHMERDKNKLEQSFLAYPGSAFQKAKNRILFVKNTGNMKQKILFFIVGFPITTLMTILFIVLYGGSKRFVLLRAYSRGVIAGLNQ